jgi:hypothetical protein
MKMSKNPNPGGRKKRWHISEPRCITSSVLIRLVIVALLVIAGTACKHNKRANTTVTHRAAFDFPCEHGQLTLTVLDTEGARKMASQLGVHGCGKKAVYAYYPDSDTWLLDGVVSAAPDGYHVPTHITTGRDEKRAEKKSGRQATKAEKRGGMEPVGPAPVEAAPVEAATPETPVPDPS